MVLGVVLVALLSAIAVSADKFEKEGSVYVLGDDTFDNFTKDNKFVLAEFYAPWCGHCQNLAPEYAKAAKMLEDQGSEIKLAKIDATEHQGLAERFAIEAYPTMKFLIADAETIDYNGPHRAEGMVKWLLRRTGPPVQIIKDAEKAKSLGKKEVVVVGLFNSLISEASRNYMRYAEGNDDVEFMIADSREVRDELQVGVDDVLLLLKPYDEGRVDFRGPFTVEDIESFVSANWLPLVMEFNETNQVKIFGGDVDSHMMLMTDFSTDFYKKHHECYRVAAKAFRGKIMFLTVDTAKPENEELFSFLALEKLPRPRLLVLQLADSTKKFLHEGKVTCESIVAFGNDFLDGKVPRTFSSEPVPEDWDAKPLKVLVGTSYREVVNQPGKHVFVKLYAPWCGHCQSMAEDWKALAVAFEDNPNVIVAEMDATINEVDGLNIDGFPTVMMYTDGEKEGDRDELEYNGARSLDALKKYVEAIMRGERPVPAHDEDEEDDDAEDEEEEEGEEEEEEAVKEEEKKTEEEAKEEQEEKAPKKDRDEL